jgi:flagellin-like protein
MKQIINREEDAVSPIIATIILIAITIVLAATLYTALTYYASNSTTSKPPVAVEISATLTKDFYYNCTVNGGSPIQLCNNTTFYELKINSINGCNGNISFYNIGFIITYKNGTSCGKTIIKINPTPYPYNMSYFDRNPCALKISCFYDSGKNYTTGAIAINNFELIALHPVRHMIPSSVYLFMPVKVRPNGECETMAPQNQICSIEVINHVKQFVLFSVNTS